MSLESTISKANKEVEQGRLWRAKEILGSSLSTYGYSPELVGALAEVLLKMGDDLEAGKYLLLSVDVPSESQRSAIDLFLSRCSTQNYQDLLAKFPTRVRFEDRDRYPEFLRNHLTEIGAPQQLNAGKQSREKSSSILSVLFPIGFIILTLLILVCAVFGAFMLCLLIWDSL